MVLKQKKEDPKKMKKIKLFIMENGILIKILDMEEEYKLIQMVLDILDIGKMTKHQEKVN